MATLTWDQTGERMYETGVDHGVLFQLDETGEYVDGVAWNGLTAVTESPSGAEASPQYADNMKYLNLISAEQFGCTIEAYYYPPEFEQNDGSASPTAGVTVGQQPRKTFGFCYRSLKGNDTQGNAHGYKLHLIWGALAAPSEKAYATVNDSPEAITFSWEVTTTPVSVGTVLSVEYGPTASMTIDSTLVDPAKLAILLEYLYGTESEDPTLPLPADVITILSAALTLATPTAPTYSSGTDLITIPTVTGVQYFIDGELVPPGDFGPITSNTLVRARPATGYRFPVPVQDEWLITFA
jgi:hypothetical protein